MNEQVELTESSNSLLSLYKTIEKTIRVKTINETIDSTPHTPTPYSSPRVLLRIMSNVNNIVLDEAVNRRAFTASELSRVTGRPHSTVNSILKQLTEIGFIHVASEIKGKEGRRAFIYATEEASTEDVKAVAASSRDEYVVPLDETDDWVGDVWWRLGHERLPSTISRLDLAKDYRERHSGAYDKGKVDKAVEAFKSNMWMVLQ